MTKLGRPARLHRHHGVHVAGGEGVHVGEDEVAGAVAAELGLVLPADYGEGAEDCGEVAGVTSLRVAFKRRSYRSL